jgi:hypothetical protein
VPKQKWIELFQESLRCSGTPATSGAAEALDKELAGCRFCDPRLGRRFRKLVGQLATSLGQTIPLACQDWTNTKAAYRFLSNGRVNEMAILAGHFQATRERFAATDGPVLVLHDTTEFSYTRESKEAIGILYRSCGRKDKEGRPRLHTLCGILIHHVEVRDAKGTVSQATVKVKYHRLRVYPPIGKQKQYPPLILTVIYAQESSTPRGREKIDWKLITNLPVRSRKDAVEKLAWYAMRWRIETFHKILKSGCRAEASKLRTAERIVNLIAMFCVLSWRIFWMTMMNRVAPVAPPSVALTRVETQLLDRLFPGVTKRRKPTLSTYLIKIARLGGYLARTKDPPPGNMVMWRGLSRLTDT